MANKKISALTDLGATPAVGDILPITDVSDTTGSAQGTTKKVTVADLVAAAPQGDLVASNNLSDVLNAGTARTNLGLGTAAVANTGTASGNVVVLDSVGLPAVDGSRLTNVGSTSALSVLATKTSSYTVQASDLGKVIKMSSSTAVLEVTLPTGLGTGFHCTIVQEGTVKCKVSAATGVSLDNWNTQVHTAGQYGAINVFAYDSNLFLATGDVGDTPAALLGYPNNSLSNTSTLYTITTQPQYHFDSSEVSTITESGGSVSAWSDISGNSRDSAQTTSTNQPTYTASGQNSKSYISFDGSSDFLTITNSLSFTGASTYILVTDSSNKINGLSEDPKSNAAEFYTMNGSTSGRFGSGGSYVGFTASASTSGFAILTYQNDGSSNVVLDLNGSSTELATSTGGLINAQYPVDANSIGHGGSYQNFHNGKIYEIIAFDAKLETSSLSDLNIIVSYLSAKYNVSLGSF